LVRKPHRWKWSSAAAHVNGRDDRLVTVRPLLERVGDWPAFLAAGIGDVELEAVRRHERTGRPLGSPEFVERLETILGRPLAPQKPGPKPGRVSGGKPGRKRSRRRFGA
jgi:putative transposase